MRKVTVKWVDSKSYGNEWLDKEDIDKLDVVHCESVGFIVKEDKDKILLAQSYGGEFYHGLMAIPKGCILEIK